MPWPPRVPLGLNRVCLIQFGVSPPCVGNRLSGRRAAEACRRSNVRGSPWQGRFRWNAPRGAVGGPRPGPSVLFEHHVDPTGRATAQALAHYCATERAPLGRDPTDLRRNFSVRELSAHCVISVGSEGLNFSCSNTRQSLTDR